MPEAGRSDSTVAFGVSGILRNSALVMYDRATISMWTQEGEAIAGPLRGERLRRIPSELTTWAAWRERHPNTAVMMQATCPATRPAVGRPGKR